MGGLCFDLFDLFDFFGFSGFFLVGLFGGTGLLGFGFVGRFTAPPEDSSILGHRVG